MRLIPGKIYRTKKELQIVFPTDPKQSYTVPEGVLLMFLQQNNGTIFDTTFPDLFPNCKTYYFLLGEEKIVFTKKPREKLNDYFQSTDDWNV